jgi:preprotein translocase subunit YajC
MTSGLLGKITKLESEYLILEAGNGQELKFQKVAVHAVLPKGTFKAI